VIPVAPRFVQLHAQCVVLKLEWLGEPFSPARSSLESSRGWARGDTIRGCVLAAGFCSKTDRDSVQESARSALVKVERATDRASDLSGDRSFSMWIRTVKPNCLEPWAGKRPD